MIVEAYRALELLARHPRIDPEWIALMGFSRGGEAALYASVTRFHRLHGLSDGAEFAVHIAFHPLCNTTYIDEERVAERPIRIFHGGADDFNPIAACRRYVQRLRRAGTDVQLTEYPGAHHVFDWPMLKTPLRLEQAQTTRLCRLEEAPDDGIIKCDTRRPFDYSDACVERGATIAYDADAHSKAQQAVRDFVAATLEPE